MHLVWRAFACWEHRYGGGENYVLWVSVERTVVIWLWESIWRGGGGGVVGWVLISWNNTFLLESITQKVKILLVSSLKWYFSPRSMLSTGCVRWSLKKKQKNKCYCALCHLDVLPFFTELRGFLVFTCLFFYMQSNQTIGECILGSLCTMGAKVLRDRVKQTIYGQYCVCHPTGRGGGVSMTWGYLLPLQHSLAIRVTDKIRQKKKKKLSIAFSECIGRETSALLCKQRFFFSFL